MVPLLRETLHFLRSVLGLDSHVERGPNGSGTTSSESTAIRRSDRIFMRFCLVLALAIVIVALIVMGTLCGPRGI